MPMQVGVGVAALIFDKDGYLLLVKRNGAHGAGKWAPPGGWLERDEQIADAISREALEEVGLDIVAINDDFKFTLDHHEEGVQDVCFFARCRIIGTENTEPHILEPEKITGLQWIDYTRFWNFYQAGVVFLPLKNLFDSGELQFIWADVFKEMEEADF